MKRPADPPRLLEESGTPERLSEALRLAQRVPDPSTVERLSGTLGIAAPLAPPVLPPASGLTAATGGASSLGWVAAGAVVMAVGAGTVALSGTPAPVAPSPAVRTELTPAPITAQEQPPVAPPPTVITDEPAQPLTLSPSLRRRNAEHEPDTKKPAPPNAAPAAEPAVSSPPPADAASRLREEALLVRNAERILGSAPSRALSLTEERRQRFPNGVLDQEAEVVAIDALLRLGRRDAAVARAQRFQTSHPSSVHARRIHALIGTKP